MYRRELLCVVAAGAVAGCNGVRSDDTTDEPDDERVRIADHQLVRHDRGTDEETVAVIGTLERLDEEDEINYVELRARFLGEEEELLDTTTERVEEIGEDDGWEFEVEAALVGEQAAAVESYEIEITTVL